LVHRSWILDSVSNDYLTGFSDDKKKTAEQSGRLNGFPRHASCFLASLGARVAPRAAVSHLIRWAK